jgi:outer membrane receptor protein involved in Fe transport
MFDKEKKIVLGLLFLWMPFLAVAQGKLEGKILDRKTKEPLIGATLMVDGTTWTGIADVDGSYVLPAVPEGTYAVTVRYVSYQTAHMEPVVIEKDKTTRLDVEMDAADVQLTGVQVVATRRTNTELSMLKSTKMAPLVVSGISSQQISKSLDRDAGEVIKRVPGVTIMDNRFVVVRGLNQRYNNVWLNDVSTPSSESDSRAFSFDVIPGGQIDHMMVYKSPAPEIPADFSGGFVKIYTKNMPESNSFQFSLTTGYQEGSTFESFRSGSRTSADLFGLGYSSRALPSDFPDKISSSMSKAVLASQTQSINTGWSTSQFSALPDLRLSLVFNRVFHWGDVTIGSISALNYSNTYRFNQISNKRYGIYQQALDAPYARNDYDDSQYTQDSKMGLLHNWSFVFNPKNRLEFRNFFNQIGKNRLTYREGEDNNNDYTIRETEIMYNSRTTYSGQFSGKHQFAEDRTKLDWVTGYSYANRYEPDRKIITSRLNDEATSSYYGQYGTDGNDVKRNYQNLDEQVVSGSANLEQQLIIGALAPLLKTGVLAEYKTRSFAARNFCYTYQTDLLPDGFVYSDYEEMFTAANIQTNGLFLKENTNKSDSYTANNQLYAGYAGLNIPFGTWVDVYAGVRAESNRVRLNGYESDGTDPVEVDRLSFDLFPSVNATWHLNEKNQLRLAYGQSVNRPEFREIAPYVYYDFDQFSNFEGNSTLKDAYIQNMDLRYEYYPTPSEAFSVAVFYKYFQNPIETTYFEVGGQQQYTYQNAESARNYGVELDAHKNLGVIGLTHFNLVLNGSLIQSKVSFAEGSFERDRAMQGQSPWLINGGLYYDDAASGWKGSLLYNSVGKRIVFVGIVNQDISEDIPDVYEMPHHAIDLSLSKKIGKKLELNVGVKDILNEPIEFKQFPQFLDQNGVTQKREQTTRSYLPGRNFSLTLTGRF